jgi:hypothetical protein
LCGQRPTRARLGWAGEECINLGLDAEQLPPTLADHWEQLRARAADIFRRGVRVAELIEQMFHARVVRHDSTSSNRDEG